MSDNTLNRKWFNNKYAILAGCAILIVCVFAAILITDNKFNQLSNKGDQLLAEKKYAEAITVFKEAKKYRNKQEVDQKINKAEKMLESEKMFDIGIASFNAGRYQYAIHAFEQVNSEDEDNYKIAGSVL